MGKKLAFANFIFLMIFGFTLAHEYNSHHYEDDDHYKDHGKYYDDRYRENAEDKCDEAYECLDKCPPVLYKNCLKKCLEKYPCDEINP